MSAAHTSVEMVRLQTKIRAAQASDEAIEAKIKWYSEAINDYCEREFGPTTPAPLTRTFRYNGRGYLSLAPYDLRTVDSIIVDTGAGGSPWTLTTSDWAYAGDAGGDGSYWSLVLPERRLPVLMTVTGAWGTAEVPGAVEAACVMAVGDAIRNPEGFSSRSIGELAYSEVDEPPAAAGRNLPPDARAMLGPHRRMVYA